MAALAEQVRQAKGGDRAAFGRLVERFQDMAVGYALGWLGDPESARDAAQDAFVDAYLHLSQLDEPAAFPGWLRRIVIKHCDRRTRRKPLPLLEASSPTAGTDELLADRDARDWLRRAIETLPEHERIVVALHYLGDEPQQEVADFLELPLTTVKKRLHSARKRLEARRSDMQAFRPSHRPIFADRIQLFLAIRAGDVTTAAEILSAHPELLEAEEQWTAEEALAGGFPLAHRITPLILASTRGDRAMVEMLLSRGAAIDGACGCGNAETALWTAVLHGRDEVVARLLDAGADPNHANAVGHTALHVAAMRGRAELMQVILQHGGDPERRSASGATASDLVPRHRNSDGFAPALFARARVAASPPLRAPRSRMPRYAPLQRAATTHEDCSAGTHHNSSVEVLAREKAGGDGPLLETGIRAIDLFTPLARGLVVRVHGAAETGLMVLLAELSRRFGDRGIRSIWATRERMPWHKNELATVVAELGIDDCTTVSTEGECEGAALFLFETEGHAAEIEALLPRLRTTALITFVIEPWAAVTRGERAPPELRPPYGAVIRTSAALAAEEVYPAIDPASASNVAVSAEHARMGDEVRLALEAGGGAAQRIKAVMGQPFFTWQHQNGRPGEVTPLVETLARFAGALAS